MISYRKILVRIGLWVGVAALISCGRVKNTQLNSDTWDIWVQKRPLTMELTQKANGNLSVLTGGEKSGLFYIANQDTQYLTDLKEVVNDGKNQFRATYNTTDQRTATITISTKDNGEISVGLQVDPSDGVTRRGAMFTAFPNEAYYGLMERPVDGPQDRSWEPGIKEGLDLRGQTLTMFTKPTPSIYDPFYVSSKGYGVYVHGTWPGEYDIASSKKNRVSFSFEGDALNLDIIPGPKPVEAVQNYNEKIGKPFLPPKWAFSIFHWRDEHNNRDTFFDGTKNTSPYNSELTEDILMLQALDIPNSVYWVDRPWAKGPEGYSDFEWDPQRFPNAEEMVQWVRQKDKKFLLWIAPWIMGDMLKEARQKGYLIPGTERINLRNPNDVRQLVDFTNPDAVEWWGTYLKKVVDDGVTAFKLDRSEEMMPDTSSIVLDNDKTARQLHNKYPQLYLKATYDNLKKFQGNENFLLMPRAAYTNSRQYGVFWGGDIPSGPWGLRTALIAVQRSAYMGFPVWGSDTGGYWGKEENFTHENLSRWLAFSCFTPIMEVGPLRNRAMWDMPYSPSYDTTLIATYRTYAKVHQNLQGYSYQMAQKAHDQGMPIIRPLSMIYPNDSKAATRWDEYQYGDDILVGIIWQNDQRSFDMYLPEGSWKDAWTGKEYDGDQTVSIDCPLPKIPIFVKNGSDIDLGDLNQLYQESLDIARKVPDMGDLVRKEKF